MTKNLMDNEEKENSISGLKRMMVRHAKTSQLNKREYEHTPKCIQYKCKGTINNSKRIQTSE
jgi:hypothetical protein